MDNTREMLIKLLCEANNLVTDACLEATDILTYAQQKAMYADHLIANGVTVQDSKVVEIDQFNKWIPVTERLPEKNDYYLCCVKSFVYPGRTYINILECTKDGFKEGHIYTDDVTHWMPLPEQPKGE